MGEVDTDLMRPTGMDLNFQQAEVSSKGLYAGPIAMGKPALGIDSHFGAVAGVSAYGELDGAGVR